MESIIAANAKSLERLRAFVSRLSDEDLGVELDAGWTVGALLAHLGFWDQRALALVRRWQAQGFGPSPLDADAINDAARPLFRELPATSVRSLVLEAAAATDQAVAALAPSLADQIREHASTFHLSRAVHRNLHLDELDRALARTSDRPLTKAPA